MVIFRAIVIFKRSQFLLNSFTCSRFFMRLAEAAKFSQQGFANYASEIADHLANRRIDNARQLFDEISSPGVYLSMKMMSAYLESFRLNDALKLFDELPIKDIAMWNLLIKGCVESGNLEKGLKMFDEMPERNVISWTTMIDALLKNKMVEEAEGLFQKMPDRDTAAWNAMLHGLFANGRHKEAINLFEMIPNKNTISWTTIISGLDHIGRSDEALTLFKKMVGFGFKPTSGTFSCAITACANVGSNGLGSQIHCHVLKLGYIFHAYVAAPLITFYANCKCIEASVKVFSEKMHQNVVVWTSLVTGYGDNGKHEDALRIYRDMLRLWIAPNQLSFASALNSSRGLESIDWGKGIHCAAIKNGLETDAFVGNSLVVLYAKCGNISDAILSFDEILDKNIVSWNAVIAGCANHGCGEWAMTFFTRMAKTGLEPDDITFTGLLSACSHSGMLQKGQKVFESLCEYPNIEVKLEHYTCMVNILCRSGKLTEAEELIKEMPMEPCLSIWLALLGGCRLRANLEIAERVARKILGIDPHCSAAYVLMSNIYAFSGRWADVARIRGAMQKMGTVKQPGRSWVLVRGIQHSFVSCGTSHPLSKEIYKKVEWLGMKLKEHGYVPDRRYALHDVEDEHKVELLSYHSERLAVCFALISGSKGGTITVMKNLRTCEDCHAAMKLVAKIVRREIVIRDSSRFHRFRDGFCSCRDYW